MNDENPTGSNPTSPALIGQETSKRDDVIGVRYNRPSGSNPMSPSKWVNSFDWPRDE